MTKTERRLLGRYDTPAILAKGLVGWGVRSKDDTVFEPSSGGGVFIEQSMNQLLQFGKRSIRSSIGTCDIDGTACQNAIKMGVPQSQVYCSNFVSQAFKIGEKYDAVIGNPPYLRPSNLSDETRQSLRQVQQLYTIGKKANLWAYFILAAFEILKEGGRIGFVVPESILHSDYSQGLLEICAKHFNSVTLLSIRERCFMSEGAKERVVLALFDNFQRYPNSSQKPAEVRGVECNKLSQALEFLSQNETARKSLTQKINGYVLPQLISKSFNLKVHRIDENMPFQRLGDLADIKIGVVTGDTPFFVLNESKRQNLGIPRKDLSAITPRFPLDSVLRYSKRSWNADLKSDSGVWLFCPEAGKVSRASLDYIESYDTSKIQTVATYHKRTDWYAPLLIDRPDGFFKAMSTDGPRLLLNEAKVICTNSLYGVYFKPHVTARMKKLVSMLFHSTIVQISSEITGRTFGSGMLKLEPSDVKRLWMPIAEDVNLTSDIDDLWRKCSAIGGLNSKKQIRGLIDEWVYDNYPSLSRISSSTQLERSLKVIVNRRNYKKACD